MMYGDVFLNAVISGITSSVRKILFNPNVLFARQFKQKGLFFTETPLYILASQIFQDVGDMLVC